MEQSLNMIERFRQDPHNDRLFVQERTILEMTEKVCRLMREQGVTRSELAERIGKSKSHVTQLLSGGQNLTLRTLSDMLHALGQSLEAVTRPASEAPRRYYAVTDGGDWTDDTPVAVPRSEGPLKLHQDPASPRRGRLAG